MNQWAKVPVAGKIKLLAKHGAGAKQIVDAHYAPASDSKGIHAAKPPSLRRRV
jgi:hypothetical protein